VKQIFQHKLKIKFQIVGVFQLNCYFCRFFENYTGFSKGIKFRNSSERLIHFPSTTKTTKFSTKTTKLSTKTTTISSTKTTTLSSTKTTTSAKVTTLSTITPSSSSRRKSSNCGLQTDHLTKFHIFC
jgi:hypothetical protein